MRLTNRGRVLVGLMIATLVLLVNHACGLDCVSSQTGEDLCHASAPDPQR